MTGPAVSESVWAAESWATTFGQFAKASGLTISVFDPQGVRAFGPVHEHPLAHLIYESGGWNGGPCDEKEAALVRECLATAKPALDYFLDAFLVQAHPIVHRGQVYGVLVVGWVFDQFADPRRCARLARAFGIPENAFWRLAREQPPIGRDRIGVFVSLLRTMVGAILGQLTTLAEARDANRIKDQFLATASHELRTPLTSMRVRVQLMQRMRGMTEEQLRQGLQIIDRGITAQDKLVEDLLDASRASTGKLRLELEPINPAELLLSAVETVTPAAETKRVQITAKILPPLRKYTGDVTRLSQVFWNLLNNAVKFTPDLGFIGITAKEIGGRFVVDLTDSGRGLDETNLTRIFEPFFQVETAHDANNTGLGLGLSVVKSILELHGGTVQAESAGLGQGTRFVLSLPSVS